MGAVVLSAYQNIGFPLTVVIGLGVALVGTQLPNIFKWTRRRFYPGGVSSLRSIGISLVALITATIVLIGNHLLPHSTQQETPNTNERIVTLETRLASKTQEADNLSRENANLRQNLPARGSQFDGIDARAAFNMITDLESGDVDKTPRTVLITSSKEYTRVVEILEFVIRFADSERQGADKRSPTSTTFSAPNTEFWSNVPVLSNPDENGIVLHGMDTFNNALAYALQRCFQVKRDPEPISPEIAARLVKLNGFPNDHIIIWVAIGSKGPWKQSSAVGCI